MADLAIALLDTAVLFPAALRDTLLRAAQHGLFEAKWSAETLDELGRALIRTGQMTEEGFGRLLASLTTVFPAATVSDYSGYLSIVTNHPKDHHVLAAAIVSRSDVIVTPNLRDFSDQALAPFSKRALTPDAFLLELHEHSASILQEIIELQWQELHRPPMSRDQVLDSLAAVVPRFAEVMRDLPR